MVFKELEKRTKEDNMVIEFQKSCGNRYDFHERFKLSTDGMSHNGEVFPSFKPRTEEPFEWLKCPNGKKPEGPSLAQNFKKNIGKGIKRFL